jgi:hypothetical protein
MMWKVFAIVVLIANASFASNRSASMIFVPPHQNQCRVSLISQNLWQLMFSSLFDQSIQNNLHLTHLLTSVYVSRPNISARIKLYKFYIEENINNLTKTWIQQFNSRINLDYIPDKCTFLCQLPHTMLTCRQKVHLHLTEIILEQANEVFSSSREIKFDILNTIEQLPCERNPKMTDCFWSDFNKLFYNEAWEVLNVLYRSKLSENLLDFLEACCWNHWFNWLDYLNLLSWWPI